MTDAKHLRRSSLAILGGTAVGQGLGYAYAVIAARTVGPLAYGQFVLVFSLVTVCTALATLGFSRTIVRFVSMYSSSHQAAQLKGSTRAIGAFLLCTSACMTIALLLSAPYVARHYLKDESLVPLIRVASLIIPLTVLSHYLFDMLRGLRLAQYKTYVESFVQKPLRLTLIAVPTFPAPSAQTLLLIEIISGSVGLAFSIGLVGRKFKPLINRTRSIVPAREIFRYSLPMIPASLLIAFGAETETLILGWLGFAVEAGMLNAAVRTASIGSVILLAFNANFAPLISSLTESHQTHTLINLFRRLTRWQMMVMVGWAGLTILLSKDFLLLFGEEYSAGAQLALILLCLRQVVDTIFGPVGLMVTMGGWAVLTLINAVAFLAFSVSFDLLMIPRWGTTGAALSIFVTAILLNSLVSFEVWRLFRGHALSARNVGLVVFGLGMVPAFMFLRSTILGDYSWLVQILTIAGSYLFAYAGVVMALMTFSERQWLFGSVRNITRKGLRYLGRGPV